MRSKVNQVDAMKGEPSVAITKSPGSILVWANKYIINILLLNILILYIYKFYKFVIYKNL